MHEELFLRNLHVTYDDTGCYVNIPILRVEFKALEIVPCDENGANLDFSKAQKNSIAKLNSNNNRLYFQQHKSGDQYFRIVPVLEDETRIQCDDDKGNVVKINMLKNIVQYKFEPQKKAGILGRRTIPAKLSVNCTDEVKSGDIGYVINNIFFPLPSFRGFMEFNVPVGDLQMLTIRACDDEADKHYKISAQVNI